MYGHFCCILGHTGQLWFSVDWATQESKYQKVGIIEAGCHNQSFGDSLNSGRSGEMFLIATQMVSFPLVNLRLDNIKDLSRVNILYS